MSQLPLLLRNPMFNLSLLVKTNCMNKFLLYTTILLLAASCKKDDKVPGLQSKSQWTVDGVAYKGFAQIFPIGGVVEAADTINGLNQLSGNFVSIRFLYGYWPTKGGTYRVMHYPGDTSQCSITIGNLARSPTGNFTSVESMAMVNVTISVAGKFIASFSDVVVADYDMTKTKIVSARLEEQ